MNQPESNWRSAIRVLGLLSLCLCFAPSLSAQTATPAHQLQWDQDALSLPDAQALTYTYVLDGGSQEPLPNHLCSGAVSPYVCQAPFPAVTPGQHDIALIANNEAGSSLPSSPLSFRFVIVPNPPRNLRTVR